MQSHPCSIGDKIRLDPNIILEIRRLVYASKDSITGLPA
jgi:hypothetical protein